MCGLTSDSLLLHQQPLSFVQLNLTSHSNLAVWATSAEPVTLEKRELFLSPQLYQMLLQLWLSCLFCLFHQFTASALSDSDDLCDN